MQRGLFAGLLVLSLFTACSKNDDDKGGNNNGGGGGGGIKTKAVSITGFAFSPSSITIDNGTTVTWTNEDEAPHTVTADDASFTSGDLKKGDTFSHKFTAAGTVAYHCNIHPSMTASVTVQ